MRRAKFRFVRMSFSKRCPALKQVEMGEFALDGFPQCVETSDYSKWLQSLVLTDAVKPYSVI